MGSLDERGKGGGDRRQGGVQLLYATGKSFTVDGLREKLRELFRQEVRAVAALNNVELISALISFNRKLALIGLQLRLSSGPILLPHNPFDAKAAAGRSERYCRDLRRRLGRLRAAFAGKIIAQISTADLEGFLTGLNAAAETRNSFRRNIHTLWGFAEKRGWAQRRISGLLAAPPPRSAPLPDSADNKAAEQSRGTIAAVCCCPTPGEHELGLQLRNEKSKI